MRKRVCLKSPVRANRTPGSVRGRSGNWPSYRDGPAGGRQTSKTGRHNGHPTTATGHDRDGLRQQTKTAQTDERDGLSHPIQDRQHHALPGSARPRPLGVGGDESTACLSAWPNKRLQATGHSVRFWAGVGLYRVARA